MDMAAVYKTLKTKNGRKTILRVTDAVNKALKIKNVRKIILRVADVL
jgi:hypothetical protein